MQTTQWVRGLLISERQRLRSLAHCLLGGLLLAGVVWSVGCSRNDRPPLANVQGTVTLDGQPLVQARVAFEPVGGGRTSYGVTDEAGRYHLLYIRDIKGAIVGSHKVRFFDESEDSRVARVPARYNKQSDLTAEVRSGTNTFDFDLKGN